MATQSQGIQQLLAAEKKAAEIVAEARKSMLFFSYLFFPFWLSSFYLFEQMNREDKALEAGQRGGRNRGRGVQEREGARIQATRAAGKRHSLSIELL